MEKTKQERRIPILSNEGVNMHKKNDDLQKIETRGKERVLSYLEKCDGSKSALVTFSEKTFELFRLKRTKCQKLTSIIM